MRIDGFERLALTAALLVAFAAGPAVVAAQPAHDAAAAAPPAAGAMAPGDTRSSSSRAPSDAGVESDAGDAGGLTDADIDAEAGDDAAAGDAGGGEPDAESLEPVEVPSAAPGEPLPMPSASAEPPKEILPGVSVRLADEAVFAIRVPRGGRTAEQRAAEATRLLAGAAEGARAEDVLIQRRGEVLVVLVQKTPIVQLGPEDAEAAGDVSLEVHGESVLAALRKAVDAERRRAAIAKSVLSFSFLVFLGLVAFYLVQKVGDFAGRAREWLEVHGERVLAVRVRRIEVVSPGTVKSTALVALGAGKWIAQLGIVYTWLVVVLSLFEGTRGYTERLTGFVLSPLSDLMTRVVKGLPTLVVLVIAGFAVFVLVRFVGLFFGSVARRETVVSWIPADFVAPVSAVVRFGIVLGALVFLVPVVTGDSEGALARSGYVLLIGLGLGAIPIFASGLAGAVVLFGRRLRAGQFIEIGPHRGRVAVIGLLELFLEDESGAEIRVPHLYTLGRPTRVLGLRPKRSLEIAVAPSASPSAVLTVLASVAASFDRDHRLELASADADAARYRIVFSSERAEATGELRLALFEALQRERVPLGRGGGRDVT